MSGTSTLQYSTLLSGKEDEGNGGKRAACLDFCTGCYVMLDRNRERGGQVEHRIAAKRAKVAATIG